MKRLLLSGAMAAILLTQTSCLGSFVLTKSLLEFNTTVTNDKIVNNLVFMGLCILPVYEIALFVDAVALNLIEFWTGENPVAMNEGEIQEQLITHNGVDYKISATKNQFKFEKVLGDELVDLGVVSYTSDDMVWNYEFNGETNPIVQINDNNSVTYFTANGKATVVNNDIETLVYERSMANGLIEMAKK